MDLFDCIRLILRFQVKINLNNVNWLWIWAGIRGALLPFLLVIKFCTLFIPIDGYCFDLIIIRDWILPIYNLPRCSCSNMLCALGCYSVGAVHEIWGQIWNIFKPWWIERCRCCSRPSVASLAGECPQHNVLLLRP